LKAALIRCQPQKRRRHIKIIRESAFVCPRDLRPQPSDIILNVFGKPSPPHVGEPAPRAQYKEFLFNDIPAPATNGHRAIAPRARGSMATAPGFQLNNFSRSGSASHLSVTSALIPRAAQSRTLGHSPTDPNSDIRLLRLATLGSHSSLRTERIAFRLPGRRHRSPHRRSGRLSSRISSIMHKVHGPGLVRPGRIPAILTQLLP
jgi:hypothetical protein